VSRDISHILDGWDFEPKQIVVRIIAGDDGREKIQMRLDLGLLQMEVDGRPDGQRPEGCDSWLDYYRLQQQVHASANPDTAPFLLDEEACDRLLREGNQYYYRYLSFWHLQRYELCARDTNRNLKLFQFVREHARSDQDKRRFDQYRPYVTMMHSRAVATPLLELGDYETAVKAIDAGVRGIRRFLEEYEQSGKADQCRELVELEQWRDEIVARQPRGLGPVPDPEPSSPLARLQLELREAVTNERFEEAARLRDEIRRIESEGPA
jgi:hypothetical protein